MSSMERNLIRRPIRNMGWLSTRTARMQVRGTAHT
jgi:hypothetical protein